MSKFSLSIECNADPDYSPLPEYTFNIDARDEDEAVCAGEAIATFIENRLAKNIKIIVFDLKTANHVKTIIRPMPLI